MTITVRAQNVARKFMSASVEDRNEAQLQELVAAEFARAHAAEMRKVPAHKREEERREMRIELWTHYIDLVRAEAEKAGYTYTN